MATSRARLETAVRWEARRRVAASFDGYFGGGRDLGAIDQINEKMRNNAPAILRTYGMIAGRVVPGLEDGLKAATLGQVSVSQIYEELGKGVLLVAQHSEPIADILLMAIMEPSFLVPPFLPGPGTMAQVVTQLYKAGFERYLIAMVVAPGVGPVLLAAVEGAKALYDSIFGESAEEKRQRLAATAEATRRRNVIGTRIADLLRQIDQFTGLIVKSYDPCVTDKLPTLKTQLQGAKGLLLAAQAQLALFFQPQFVTVAGIQARDAGVLLGKVQDTFTACGLGGGFTDLAAKVAAAKVRETAAKAAADKIAAQNVPANVPVTEDDTLPTWALVGGFLVLGGAAWALGRLR